MTLADLWRLIRSLLVALGAPAGLVMCLWRRDVRLMRAYAHFLEGMGRRGARLRHDGEDEATMRKRFARMQWIVRDPRRAARHLARRMVRSGDFNCHRLGAMCAPVSWTPPRVALAPLALSHPHETQMDVGWC